MGYVTAETIRMLREKKGCTQKELAETLCVSDKTVSKWETGRGLPDVSLLEPLARALGVSVAELLSGECAINLNRSGNMLRSKLYVCPVCGNVLFSSGAGAFSCCGVTLPPLDAEPAIGIHSIKIENIDGECYISMEHPMEKGHFISFFAYSTTDRVFFTKLYAEQSPEARFPKVGCGILYAYCNRDGLFSVRL